MKSSHYAHCLVGVAVAVGLLVVFGVQAGTLVYLTAALACPLMMVVMMRGMTRSAGHGCPNPDNQHATSMDSTERTR